MKNSFDEFAIFSLKLGWKIANVLYLLDFYKIQRNVLVELICIDFTPNRVQMAPDTAP